MTLERKVPLRANAETTRAWQDRSRKALPKRSALQVRIDRERVKVKRDVLARDGERCAGAELVPEVQCGSPFPERPPLELHELVERSRWRMGAVERDNCRLLCQLHHDWIENNVTEAYVRGLLRRTPLPS